MTTLLSILMPVFNEEDTVAAAVQRLLAVDFGVGVEIEVVVVDDGSTDRSHAILEQLRDTNPERVILLTHEQNRGKGAAIRSAIARASGEFAVVQDSDLEYDPTDLPRLIRPLIEGRADAVFGSRFLNSGERRVLYFWNSLANHFLTTVCNIFADMNLTDVETGYKAFRLSLVKSIPLRSDRFGIEPELAIKLAQRGAAVYEVPVSYHGRTYIEGKKIGAKDAFIALAVILKYGLRRDIYHDDGERILDTLARTPRFNQWMADTVAPYAGPRILELGAGIGNLSAFLSRSRQTYFATDINAAHLERLRVRFQNRPNVSISHCDLSVPEDFAPFEGQVDTVVCLNVLEHVEDDVNGLRNIGRALRVGGTAVVLVPQDESIYGTLDTVLGHCRRYSEDSLRQCLREAGFDVKAILRFNRITRPGWYLNGRILRRRRFSVIQLWFFDRLVWLWRKIDRHLPWRSLSIIAIAEKPGRQEL
ncbi:MAG: glycosyltransferase [Bryobacteraceae bacterium]